LPVLLHQSFDIPPSDSYELWFATTGTSPELDTDTKLSNLAVLLEDAFMACRTIWWDLGRALGSEPTANIAHMPTGGAFGSDFGIMLAWSTLVEEAAQRSETCLVLCDDPWLFRHLTDIPGVDAGSPPRILYQVIRMFIRGILSRTKASIRVLVAAVRLRHTRKILHHGEAVLLVYGHPSSTSDGKDAYFGDLLQREPQLRRILHTDCTVSRAQELFNGGDTLSLHAWGNPFFAFQLIFSFWNPSNESLLGKFGWLIRRAAAKENSGGGPAMNQWQLHCQENWLRKARPNCVCWPWENHAWERGLCRSAKNIGIRTLGYQHTVVGPHQINYSTASNPDGVRSIPDKVISNGPAYRDEMEAWGVPAERLKIAGAFRFSKPRLGVYNSDGPIFVPLSAVPEAARAQVEAAEKIAGSGRRVVIKEHPMYPLEFSEMPNLSKTTTTLVGQTNLSAVLYCTGTSGLEAVLMGLPTYRLILDDRIAIDILPSMIKVPSVTLDNVVTKVTTNSNLAPFDFRSILTDVDYSIWHSLLFDDIQQLDRLSNDSR
jgi:hypothetical protein